MQKIRDCGGIGLRIATYPRRTPAVWTVRIYLEEVGAGCSVTTGWPWAFHATKPSSMR